MTLSFNPLSVYAYVFIFAFFLYELGYSDLYPELTLEVLIFVWTTVFLSLFLSFFLKNGEVINTGLKHGEKRRDKFIFAFLVFLLIAEFIHARGVPFFSIVFGYSFDYKNFGIPFFHVLFVVLNLLFGVLWFDKYKVTGFGFYLCISLFTALFFVLIFNRGALVGYLVSIVYLLFCYSKLKFSSVIKILFVLSVSGYIFGQLGNLRSASSSAYGTVDGLILKIGGANDNFEKSGLADEFFWLYIYVSSPLANFQNSVDEIVPGRNFKVFFAQEVVPDFISKRFYPDQDYVSGELITPELTVSTAFSRGYKNIGWFGPVFVYLYFLFLVYISHRVLIRTKYYSSGMALLTCVASLMVFTNTLVFSGYILPFFLLLVVAFVKSNYRYLR